MRSRVFDRYHAPPDRGRPIAVCRRGTAAALAVVGICDVGERNLRSPPVLRTKLASTS